MRTLALGLLGLALLSGSASANGWGPGNVQVYGNFGVRWNGAGNCQPYQLGPWYQYFPYEAHFQQPALPQYPYWGAQALPNGLPYLTPGGPGGGPAPAYWGK